MGIKIVIASLAMITLCLGHDNANTPRYGAAGCGLGSVIIPGKGLISQTSAGTTNASSGQFYSMTTGTFNCDTGLFNLFSSNNLEFMKFMNNNMDKIALDISKGNGEYLKHISKVYNVEYLSVSKKLQANFTEIYTHDNIQVDEVIFNIEKVINS